MQLEYEDLVRQARDGDRGAYDEVVRRFQQSSLAYAYSVLGDHQLAEDATQAAFLSAYLDLMQLRDVRAFPGWLRRIVNNEAMNVLRRHRLKTQSITEQEHALEENGAGPAEQAREQEVLTGIREAIGELPEGEAEIARLYFLEEAKLGEIAERLGLTEEATKSRLRRARVRLQQRLVGLVDAGRKTDMKTNSKIRREATQEAIEQLRAERERLTRTTREDQQRMTDLLCAEGRLHRFLGQTDAAIKVFSEGLRKMRGVLDANTRARLRAEIGICYVKQAKYMQAEKVLTEAQAALRPEPTATKKGGAEGDVTAAAHRGLKPSILNALGTCAWGKGNFKRARKLWESTVRASQSAPGSQGTALEAAALNNMSLLDWKRGELARAAEGFKQCRARWQKLGNRHGLAQTLVNVGILEESQGRLAAANTHYRKALQLAQELKFLQLEGVVYSNLANLALARGEWEQALRDGHDAAALARETGDRRSEAIAHENIALGQIGLKDWRGAEAELTVGRKLAEAIGDQERQFSLDLVEVELNLGKGEHTATLRKFRALEKVLKRREYAGEEARLQRLWAEAEWSAGQKTAARRRLGLALEISRRQGNRAEEKRAEAFQKGVSGATGETTSAKRGGKPGAEQGKKPTLKTGAKAKSGKMLMEKTKKQATSAKRKIRGKP